MGRTISVCISDLEALAAQGNYRVANVAGIRKISPRHMRRCLHGTEENKGAHALLAELRLKQMLRLREKGKSYKEIGAVVSLHPSYVSVLLKAAGRPKTQPSNLTEPRS